MSLKTVYLNLLSRELTDQETQEGAPDSRIIVGPDPMGASFAHVNTRCEALLDRLFAKVGVDDIGKIIIYAPVSGTSLAAIWFLVNALPREPQVALADDGAGQHIELWGFGVAGIAWKARNTVIPLEKEEPESSKDLPSSDTL